MIYLYVTPSGSVNLIEGEKMPVKPVIAAFQSPTIYTEALWKAYEKELEAAKASSVPVDDQEREKDLIHGLTSGDFQLRPDTIYGPFDIGYGIQPRCCANEKLPIGMCERDCEAYESFHKIKGPKKVAILLPKSEPVGKLEEKEVESAATAYGESFKTGEWFERLRIEAFKAGAIWAQRRGFTITRKPIDS